MKGSVVPRHRLRCIQRYLHGGATSWVVCLKRAGRKHVRYFADGESGSTVSLGRAIAWRDLMERQLTPWNKLHQRSAVNTTGHIGVSVLDDRTRAGTLVRRWVAHWHAADGRGRKRSFSVRVYGETEAKRRAIAARRAGVAELLASWAIR